MKNILLVLISLLSLSCSEAYYSSNQILELKNNSLTSGERVEFNIINKDININEIKCSLKNSRNNSSIEDYYLSRENDKFIINRFLNLDIPSYENYKLSCDIDNYEEKINQEFNINIDSSIIINKFCHTENCDTLSGNVINLLPNNISINILKIPAIEINYLITTPYNSYEFNHKFNSAVDNDILENIVLEKVPDDISYYIALLEITASDNDGNSAITKLPFKVVRPLEIKHFGKYELAEIFEPVPVTGCIPGSVGSNVQYSESESETRQNSVSININKSWSDSFSNSNSISTSEGISIGQTESTVLSSSMSNSETQSDSYTTTNSESESNNISFNTTDGENWAWSLGESNSETQSQSQSNNTNTGVNASTTVGVSGEGSLPFLAKASGKVDVSAGVSRNWGETNTSGESQSNTNSRGYSTGGSSQSGRSYGSSQNDSRSHSLSGAYVLSSSTSNSLTESFSLSSGRVWNMSESSSSGKVVTEGNSESISQTIVDSSSSSTTFSYSGYIPRGRFGIFFRQTSRYVKLSEIITYTLNGFPTHSGYIMMNTWSWAPELSLANSCEEAMESNLPRSSCLILPCEN